MTAGDSQHPVIPSKALFHEFVLCPLSTCKLWTSMSVSRSSQPRDTLSNLWCCQLNLFPTTSTCQCPIPLPGVCCWSSLSMPFMTSLTFVLAPFPAISLTLFQTVSFLLLFLIQKQFHTFDHPYCPFLKLFQHLYTFLRKKYQKCMQNRRNEKSWAYEVAWWWCPVFSFFLSWQLFIFAFP